MKKSVTVTLCFILIFALLFIAVMGYHNTEERSIKLMSFNIRCLTLEDNAINNWGNRQKDVIDVILKYQPDLIGFQEMTNFQYDFMKRELDEIYGYYGVFRSAYIYFNECSAIFYKKERFDVIEEDTFWLSETPDVISVGWDASIERVCSRLTLKDKNTNKIFNHFNTHFDHKGDIAQQQSVFLLLDKIAEEGLPSVVTGDFNIKEQSENYNNLIKENLKDSKYLAPEEKRDLGATYNGFGRYIEGRPIDFILVSQEDFLVKSYNIIRDADNEGNYPSDHFPIMSVLKQVG